MGYHGYEQIMADLYDDDYAVARTPSGDVDFYVEAAKNANGPVIEWGCGTGRILVPTAQAGVSIVGVDQSVAMLEKVHAKLAGTSLDARVVEGDMRTSRVEGEFALATVPFRAIAHLETVEDQLAAFANVARHLRPGGQFIVDFFNPRLDLLGAAWGPRLGIDRADGRGGRVRRYEKAEPNVAQQINRLTFRWELEDKHGQVEEQEASFNMRWYYRFELEHLLVRSGFVVNTVWGDFRGRPFEDGCPEIIVVSHRK